MKPVSETSNVIVFRLENQLHALPVDRVDRILRIVEITPPPYSRPFLMGYINVEGKVVPVINTRLLLGVKVRDIELSDQLILLHGPQGLVALWVDDGTNIYTHNPPQRPKNPNASAQRQLSPEVIQTKEGLIFIHEIEKLLRFLVNDTNDYGPLEKL